jgi:hypothetical protein
MFHQSLIETLSPLFDGEPTFFTDNPEVLSFLKENKLISYSLPSKKTTFSDCIPDNHTDNAVVLMTDADSIDSQLYHTLFKNSRSLFLPLYAFGSDTATALYTIESLKHSNFTESTKLNGHFLELLARVTKPITLKGNGTDISYELGGKVDLMYAKQDLQLHPSEMEPIAALELVQKNGHLKFTVFTSSCQAQLQSI